MEAAIQENTDALKILLSKGADAKAKDQEGKTPLIIAAEKGRTVAAAINTPEKVKSNSRH